MHDFSTLVRASFAAAGRAADPDVIEELAQHAAAAWEAARADGLSGATATAHVSALLERWCSDPALVIERRAQPAAITPPAAESRLLAGLTQDVRYAARLLQRQPGSALIAVLIIALGIGTTTTLFSVAYGVLVKPLPWIAADRLVQVTESRQGQAARIRGTVTNGSYLAWQEAPATIDAIGGYSVAAGAMTIRTGRDEPLRIPVGRLTPSMFDVLQVAPQRGRRFEPGDAQIGGGAYPNPRVIILSHGLWRDVFGGREDILGHELLVDDVPVTVVGVMPPDFSFPDRGARAWLPMPIGSVLGDNGVRRIMIFGALARLKPGVTVTQAASEATARARTAPDPGFAAVSMFGSAAPPDIAVTPALEAMTAEVKPALTLLMAAATLLLITAIANVGGLQAARATVRRRELAVRAAIGATSLRLTRQLVVESALIGVAGGASGILLTLALHRAVPLLLPADFPRIADIEVNAVTLLVAIALSIAASVACGVLPALQARRADAVAALAEGSGGSTARAWRGRTGRLRLAIMAGQVAVATLLLIGAALLTRSFVALVNADRGYDPVNLLTARVDLGRAYDGGQRVMFADAIVERLRAVPGVLDVAAGNALPFVTSGGTYGFAMPSPANPAIKQEVQTLTRLVSPAYLETLRLRLLAGRTLLDSDTLTSRPVVVVNRSFAQRYLGANPIGRQLPMPFGDGRPDCDVVGVVEDMRQGGVTEPAAPELFISYRQVPARLVNGPLIFVLRTAGDAMTLVPFLRAAVRERDPAAPLDSVMTMDERLRTDLARPRLYALLLIGFGASALTIAAVGLFGVLSYIVTQRSREIGVRTALGARTWDVVMLVVKIAGVAALGGFAVGGATALALARLVGSFLYGVAERDLASIVLVAVVLTVAVAAACILPARRAARVDPLVVLKSS